MIQIGNKEIGGITIGGKEVASIVIGNKTAYEKEVVDYFYVQNEYAGTNTITLKATKTGSPSSSSYTATVQYSKDKNSWTNITFATSSSPTITMSEGEKVYFRNDSGKFNFRESSSKYWYNSITCSDPYSIGGNINTLLDYTNADSDTLPSYCFYRLFQNSGRLISAENLSLPAKTLSAYCYQSLFQNCLTLTTAPAILPATTLANYCYTYMFSSSKINVAPELPATTLKRNCYESMFTNTYITECVLPATTLAQECYKNMFSGASRLNSVTTYANNISASNCLNNWLGNVANSGTFHNLGSATYTTDSASGIPTGWTEDTSNRFVFSNTVITDVGNNQAQLTSGIQVNYTGSWDDAYFEVYNELDKNRSIHFSPSEISNGVLTASNLISESNVATLVSPATVTIYNSGTAVWTGSVSFTVVQ